MRVKTPQLLLLPLLVALLLPLNVGCDHFLSEAAGFFDGLSNDFDDLADNWRDRDRDHDRDHNFGDWVDDVTNDIADWFD